MSWFQKFISSGIDESTSLDDSRRIRLINFVAFVTWVMSPLLFVYNWAIGNAHEGIPLLFIWLTCFLAFLFNRRGHNQIASIILLLSAIIATYWVVVITPVQVGSPYFNIMYGLLAIYLFKDKWLQTLLTLVAFLSFVFLNAYQLSNKEFALEEYVPVLLMVLGVYLGARMYDRDFKRNERKIQEQSEELLTLQEEKHSGELDLKQKDIDTVLANASMQKKIKENLHIELKIALESDNLEKEVSRIARDLKAQNDRLDQMHIVQENMAELNAQFYQRLTEAHPGLTKTEMEHCALIRLGLSSKEIATLRNSTENSVNVVKSRIRKRMSLTDQNLYGYLVKF